MFHLPREIIQLIFEYDPTYRQEYSKSLKILDNLPPYSRYEKISIGSPNIYWFHKYIDGPYELPFVNSSHLSSEYYFEILRDRKMISICATYRVKYNNIIRDLKIKHHRIKLKLI